MSIYKKLLRKESSLRRVEANDRFTMEDYLNKVAKPRVEFKREVEQALANGKITQSECSEIIGIIQKNGLPPQKFS